MKIVQSSTKRVYEIEGKPTLRVLSSGIKLTDCIMSAMGLAKGDKVSYAEDKDDNDKLYLYKTDGANGAVIGGNKAFTNTGLTNKLKVKANAIGLEIKSGNNLYFTVETNGVEFDGVEYFGLTFDKVVLGEESEEESMEESFE